MYDNKKIFILGMARSGYEVAKLLANHNCILTITDKAEQDINHVRELQDLGITYAITEDPTPLLDDSYSYVVKNPGIKLDHPICLKAEKLGIPVINELEVAYHYLNKNVKIIGVTGANGKTTTTTLIYEILKNGGLPVHLGGNIGFPMSSLIKEIPENEILVLELSAQQLHDFKDFKTDIGVLTNLTEVHLDHFGTYENYKRCKKKIFAHHTKDNLAIINGNDQDSLELTKDISSTKLIFKDQSKSDIYIENGHIIYKEDSIISLENIRLKGMHNYENIMCAIAVAKEFAVSNDSILKTLQNFTGVAHRLEFVKNVNGREFYNDSKATNVKSTQIALNSFDNPTILLLGGLDRNHSFDGILEYRKNIKSIVCYGETKERIHEFCNKNRIPCIMVDTLKEATLKAYEDSNQGDVILLSPACASWDQYKCFEDRGDDFKDTVNQLEIGE